MATTNVPFDRLFTREIDVWDSAFCYLDRLHANVDVEPFERERSRSIFAKTGVRILVGKVTHFLKNPDSHVYYWLRVAPTLPDAHLAMADGLLFTEAMESSLNVIKSLMTRRPHIRLAFASNNIMYLEIPIIRMEPSPVLDASLVTELQPITPVNTLHEFV